MALPMQCLSRGQPELRGQINGRVFFGALSDPANIENLADTLQLVGCFVRDRAGTAMLLQLFSIAAMVSVGSMFCARRAGARSTPAHRTCEFPAASVLRIDWQQ